MLDVRTGLPGKERLQRKPHTHIPSDMADIPECLELEFGLL